MITIPLFEASVAIGGNPSKAITPSEYLVGVTQISNDVTEGTVFVALKGERADGHDYVKDAESKGAVAAVVERYVEGVKMPQLLVPSSERALGQLGKIWRGRLSIPVIAVTGSVGKTSTKELISHILESKFHTHKSRQNYNNQLGVPIELMRATDKHECSVVELAMRDLNQINYLAHIARPTVGIITNIGMSHIEILKTRENIARAKSELYEGMDTEGLVVLNRDDDFYEYLRELAPCKVVSFGESAEADIRITDLQLTEKANPMFRLNDLPISMLASTGKQHAFNAAAAFAACTHLGMKPADIAARLKTFNNPHRRGSAYKSHNDAMILDSTYNAAPDSIKASLYSLAELSKRGKRTIAVIGEMQELGDHSEEAHRHIGKAIGALTKLNLLVTVGESAEYIGKEAGVSDWKHFATSTEAANYLIDIVKAKDIVLVQGSNGISLDVVVTALRNGSV